MQRYPDEVWRTPAGSRTFSGKENIAEFRRRLNENCTLTEEEMKEKVTIDMEMPFLCVTEELVKELELLEPFGKGIQSRYLPHAE